MHKLKVRLLNDGDYQIKDNNSRTFPVIVNGHKRKVNTSLVYVNGADCDALGFHSNGEDLPFYIGHEAEILK